MTITSYLNQIVALKARTGFDAYGKPAVGTSTSIKARFQDKQARLRDEKGNEYVTDAALWLLPDQTIALEDVVTYNSVNYKVVRIDTKRNLQGGIDHKKAFLVKTKE